MNRQTYIGGSDVAAILGVSPWKTPFQLYNEKFFGEREVLDEKKKAIFKRGKMLEPYILSMVSEELSLDISSTNERYAHPVYDFISCEIDAETSDGRNVEIKSVSPFSKKDWGDDGSDEIPIYYTAQAMLGLAATGKNETILGAFFGLDDLRTFVVRRDDDLIKTIEGECVKFWEMVRTRTPPPMVSVDDVLIAYPVDDGEAVQADHEIISLYNEYHQLNNLYKCTEKSIDEIKDKLKIYMGSNSFLMSGREKIATWKSQKRKGLNQKALKEAFPDLYAKFEETAQFRVLRIS